jgi:hypothetical protein
MKVYAVAESVPERSKRYLTAGKKYPVLDDDGHGFSIIDDEECKLRMIWESCAHLGGKWTRIEEPEDAGELLRDDAPALLEALSDLLSYLEDGIGDHDSEEGKKARALIAKHRGES